LRTASSVPRPSRTYAARVQATPIAVRGRRPWPRGWKIHQRSRKLNASSQKRVVALFPGDCRGWTVAGQHDALLVLGQQLGPDAFEQSRAVAVGEVGAADRPGEEGVAGEEV